MRVVVVGAGIAGLSAALSAHEAGAEVDVIERAPIEHRGGNTRFSNSAIRAVRASEDDVLRLLPTLPPIERDRCVFEAYSREEYLRDLAEITQHRCDPELAATLVDNSYATLVWLTEHGVRFVPNWDWAVKLPDGRLRVSLEAEGSGAGLSDALFSRADELGITTFYDARALELIEGARGVRGVIARTPKGPREFLADAVVLAAGGFQADPEWRARYLGPGWDLAKVRGSRYDTGDGLKMALAAGAAPYGHWSGSHSASWDLNAPDMNELEFNTIFKRDDFNFGVMVNADGDRFVDEGEDVWGHIYAKMGAAILAQPGQFAWQVYDAAVHPLIHKEYRSPLSRRVVAETLEDLVTQMDGVAREGFLATIAAFNDAVRTGIPFDATRKDGRHTAGLVIDKSNWAQEIAVPPFEAYGVTCGITFTFGGIRVDTAGRVLDVSENHIAGLYAAGDMVGGLFYSNYPGGAGLAGAAVFGRLAGRSATDDCMA